MNLQSPAAGPDERRTADLLRSERTMVWVRALGAAFAAVQVLTYGALPYPPGYREAALALVAALAVVDLGALAVLALARPRTRRQAEVMAVVTVGLDTVIASGLVAAYSFDPASAHWAVLFVVPLLGAARFRLVGALVTWGTLTLLYVLRQAFAASTFAGIGFSPTSIVFRMGLVFLVALVAGLLSRDLARQREATAQALAEVARVGELRARLVDSLAHDIRSPLVGIAGALSALDGDRPPEVKAQLQALARRQVERLTRLATGMLDLARLERGHLALDVSPTSLAAVVATSQEALGPEDGEVEVDVDEAITVAADPDRLDQVVFNLLSNALRHGRPPVRIAARQVGTTVEVVVSDHGDGVPAARQATLFDAFTTAAAGGVGLGLWLVRELVEAHDGTVTYRDGPDGGAMFVVTLPSA